MMRTFTRTAVMVGLLLALFTYALFYKTVDLPDLKRNWNEDKAEILKERGLADDPFLARQRSRFFPRPGSGFFSRRDARLFAGRDSRFLAEFDPLFDHGERGSLGPRRGGLSRDPRRPVDAIEIEPGGAVGLDVAKLETIDRGEVQQPHLANERLEEPLGDEHDTRGPAGPHACRHEALNRLGILEAPRVRLEGSHEHSVVRGETEHEQNRAVLGVDRGEVDCRATEIQIRREDLETGLHRVGVVRHEGPEVLQV